MTRLLLGTAQWGLDYGVTNTVGRLSDASIEALVAECRASGIDWIDTARGYGDAEARVGEFAPGFPVQTKLSAAGRSATDLVADLRDSLALLRRDRVDSVLIHDWPTLDDSACSVVDQAFAAMLEAGLTGAVGISGYVEADLSRAMSMLPSVNVVQLPVNVLDQRLDGSSVIDAFRAAGGRVQARSVLLQGVLAGNGGPFAGHPDVMRWSETGLGLAGAVDYVRSRPWVDDVVVGVTSAAELREFVVAWSSEARAVDWSSYTSDDVELIDPRTWVV